MNEQETYAMWSEYYLELGASLLSEIDATLSSDAWVIYNQGEMSTKVKAYGAASLRHSARLTSEIMDAVRRDQELTLRILGRAQIEAMLFGLYVHYGGEYALKRMASDLRKDNETLIEEFRQWNRGLVRERFRTLRLTRKLEKQNANIYLKNFISGDGEQILIQELPYVPRPTYARIDEKAMMRDLNGVVPRNLPLSEVVDWLTKNGPKLGLSKESFRPLYHIYRIISSVGPHPNFLLYESYIDRPKGMQMYRSIAIPRPGTDANQSLINTVFSTALLAESILGSEGQSIPETRRIRSLLEPNIDSRGWTTSK
jgi:hypothetical protein